MAVYTNLSDAELTRFLAEYDLGAVLSCKGIAEGVENSNFLLRTERGSFILTIYERRVDPTDLPFFIRLMEHLAAKGFSCPTPIAGLDGAALRRLCGKPAAIVTFLDGLSPGVILPFHCAGVGGLLAQLHAAGSGFPLQRRNALSVGGWRPLLEASAERIDEVAPGLGIELARDLDRLESQWPRGLPAGICHADLFPDNVFFRGRRISGAIDFYFACNDYFAYDIAVCLNAWCFGLDNVWEPERAQLLLDAYQAVRPLDRAERRAMPVLAAGAAARFLLTRLYDWLHRPPGALVRPKDPREYLAKLRFHRAVTGPEAYGL